MTQITTQPGAAAGVGRPDPTQPKPAQLYPTLPGFDAAALPLLGFEPGPPLPLPDALRGERWAFVSLSLDGVLAEAAQARAQRTVRCP